MRQVPHYLLIGNGRVARHFSYYFTALHLSFSQWHRQHSLSALEQELHYATHILLLINDMEIESFAAKHLQTASGIGIHMSGSLVSRHLYGAHPLMTFNDSLYPRDQYPSIPFILDEDAPAFDVLFPGLPNPHVRLSKSLKAKYHALCVLSANFSCMLWQKLFSSLEGELGLTADIAHPFLFQQTQNLIQDAKSALTGPLVRQDTKTIEKNLLALEGDCYQDIYKAFIDCYQKLQQERGRA